MKQDKVHYKGIEYDNNLHRSLSVLFSTALMYNSVDGKYLKHRKEMRKHLSYLIRWINKKGGNVPI